MEGIDDEEDDCSDPVEETDLLEMWSSFPLIVDSTANEDKIFKQIWVFPELDLPNISYINWRLNPYLPCVCSRYESRESKPVEKVFDDRFFLIIKQIIWINNV